MAVDKVRVGLLDGNRLEVGCKKSGLRAGHDTLNGVPYKYKEEFSGILN